MPTFHDVKKGWLCCKQYVYDWDEFKQIKGCCQGRHTLEKPEENTFADSTLVARGKEGIYIYL